MRASSPDRFCSPQKPTSHHKDSFYVRFSPLSRFQFENNKSTSIDCPRTRKYRTRCLTDTKSQRKPPKNRTIDIIPAGMIQSQHSRQKPPWPPENIQFLHPHRVCKAEDLRTPNDRVLINAAPSVIFCPFSWPSDYRMNPSFRTGDGWSNFGSAFGIALDHGS